MLRTRMKSVSRMLLCAAFFTLHSSLLISCSESEDDPNEFENWEVRNREFFASLEDSLKQNPAQWHKLKSYSKNPSTSTGSNTDYIYYKVITTGYETNETESPLYNDSVLVSYQGRLLPTTSYPEGYVFDSTVYGKYDLRTNATAKFQISTGLINGFSTALLRMHRFDTWRIYIPYTLGYGTTASGTIQPYSTLIFDVTLYDFSANGTPLNTKVGVNK